MNKLNNDSNNVIEQNFKKDIKPIDKQNEKNNNLDTTEKVD